MSDYQSEQPSIYNPDLNPDVEYADPYKDIAAHQHPRNEADLQALAANYAQVGVHPIVEDGTVPPPNEGPTMGVPGNTYDWEPPEPWDPYGDPHTDPETPEIVGGPEIEGE